MNELSKGVSIMAAIKSFYLSRILDRRIQSSDGRTFGKIKDLIAVNGERPQVIAAVVITGRNQTQIVDWRQLVVDKEKHRYRVLYQKIVTIVPEQKNLIYLRKHILDKQIVDIDGKKVVRVNDLRLAAISSGLFVIAVDVGLEGLLRRLDLARPVKDLLQIFGESVPSKLILWNNMEPIGSPLANLKLSTSSSKLNTLHPSELADIIEDLDINNRTAIFNSLDHERAADVLEELETDAQNSILDLLPVPKAADVLEKMPADEVADILDDLEADKVEELLQEMEQEASQEVRELMEYPEHTVGSLMSTDYISFKEHLTVAETLNELRRLKPESDTIYYLYVVDDEERLTAVLSLRDLVVAEPSTRIDQIMNRKIIFVYDTDHVNSLVEIISKYSLLAIPVVDREMKMMGMVIIDDVVYELLKPKRRKL